MIERRRSPRQRVFREAKIDCPQGVYLSCQARDLSGNGSRIRLSTVQALPDEINFEIASLALRQAARVSWQRGNEAGVGVIGPPRFTGCIPPANLPETWCTSGLNFSESRALKMLPGLERCESEAVAHFPLLHRHHGYVVAALSCQRMVGLGFLCASVRCWLGAHLLDSVG
jgi:PilZ domain-containing protein